MWSTSVVETTWHSAWPWHTQRAFAPSFFARLTEGGFGLHCQYGSCTMLLSQCLIWSARWNLQWGHQWHPFIQSSRSVKGLEWKDGEICMQSTRKCTMLLLEAAAVITHLTHIYWRVHLCSTQPGHMGRYIHDYSPFQIRKVGNSCLGSCTKVSSCIGCCLSPQSWLLRPETVLPLLIAICLMPPSNEEPAWRQSAPSAASKASDWGLQHKMNLGCNICYVHQLQPLKNTCRKQVKAFLAVRNLQTTFWEALIHEHYGQMSLEGFSSFLTELTGSSLCCSGLRCFLESHKDNYQKPPVSVQIFVPLVHSPIFYWKYS